MDTLHRQILLFILTLNINLFRRQSPKFIKRGTKSEVIENLAFIYCEDQTRRDYILQKKVEQIILLILMENAQIVAAECLDPVSGLQHDNAVPPHNDLT